MATVTKDFKVKNGIKVQGDANIDASLYVAGPNATVNGSDIITEDIITGGTQTNIIVSYNSTTKTLDFVAENGIADSTTTDLVEGTNLYFTDERAQDAIGNNLGNGIQYNDTTGALSVDPTLNLGGGGVGGFDGSLTLTSQWNDERIQLNTSGALSYLTNGIGIRQIDGNYGGYIDTLSTGQHVRLHAAEGNVYLYSNGSGKVYLGDSQVANNEVATVGNLSTSINALTTSDIEEGTNLYFTNQRAIDAVGGAATSENTPNSIVLRDTTGSFAAEDITASELIANRLNFANGSGSIDTNSTGMNIFAAAGDVNLGAMQGQVKVGGSQVTTADNTQSLTNKTILGDLGFAGTAQEVGTIGTPDGTSLEINANEDLTISSTAGDIVIRPDMLNELGRAYIGSTTAGNEIATHSYVDNAVSGLAWKQAVNLISFTNFPLAGSSPALIDNHEVDNGYRILLIAQSTATENGIYDASVSGGTYTLTRSSDADTVLELVGAAVFVMEGDQYNATSWVQNNHYANTFDDLNWTQFSGSGNYTAGFGINLIGREFSADTTEMATSEALGNAVSDLTGYVDGFLNSNDGTVIEYIDSQDSATLLAANGYSDTLVATGDATATPQYLAINVNDVAKQVAATASLPGMGTDMTVYSFLASEYRSAKFLVKLAYGTHTEVSEVLLTLDTSNNIAITEYAIVGTNGSLGTISAAYESVSGNVQLLVNTTSNATVNVVGTLLV